jgi:hypothetical protein
MSYAGDWINILKRVPDVPQRRGAGGNARRRLRK